MGKKKPYKYNSKSRLTADSQSFPFKVNQLKNDVKTNLENTLTKLKIIEEPTTPEQETLDNSFLEGRVEKKDNKKKKEKKSKEKPVEVKEDNKEDLLTKISFLRKVLLTISGVCALILIVFYVSHFAYNKISHFVNTMKNRVTVVDKKSSNVMDDNYLFVGGFHTQQFSFSEFGLDYHYVNVSRSDLTTHMLLDNMKEMVYDYNPSVIFLELGIVDLNQGVSEDEFMSNYDQIIDSIQSNRPNAIIFIESIYPINDHVDGYNGRLNQNISNEKIMLVNTKLKKLAKEKKVRYLDIHSTFNKRGELNSNYTNDGVTLNHDGYVELYNEINRVVG